MGCDIEFEAMKVAGAFAILPSYGRRSLGRAR